MAMPEEILDRRRVTGDDGSSLEAIEVRHTEHLETSKGTRKLIGARRWVLATGEALDVIDRHLLMVRKTGEILRVDEPLHSAIRPTTDWQP
ncbi:hypothetical protein [Sphingomonas oligoaromativorans]|jgi:hypothetical protein|uniref:hypothetical protein n=1 Tax=Sphingomonas oligoaromativorans TaxID=575322 RepID=UPI00141FE1C3|nr:hypothetical protein [Sphingomonas oligoaromativorans]NIJ32150.1 hypothetical protein [Sphingomonas oligoaromativorans]